jgi:hypothetical protein
MLMLVDVVAAQNWQMRRLMQPTQLEMQGEIRGGVFIYDGLHSRQIDKALDANFERMQNMMFIRTRTGSGETEVVQDDGC